MDNLNGDDQGDVPQEVHDNGIESPDLERNGEPVADEAGASQTQGVGAVDDDQDDGDRPVVELFVKAAVDKMKNGSCPTCHRYFLIFYVLRERGLIDLVVTTFLPENPPKEVLDFSNGKHYPLVKVHKGVDHNSQDLTGLECDTVDEIEALIERFDSEDMLSRKQSMKEAMAEKSFEDLYKKFNQFLKSPKDDPSILVKELEKVDDHLNEHSSKFMVGERLSRADCYLLPSLQHIRVAGKAYKEFEIPTQFRYLWRYLANAYDTEAFRESCPADREIITHYQDKASRPAKIPRRAAQLMAEDRTFSVPDSVKPGNGSLDDD